jgi:hypothetical protein
MKTEAGGVRTDPERSMLLGPLGRDVWRRLNGHAG